MGCDTGSVCLAHLVKPSILNLQFSAQSPTGGMTIHHYTPKSDETSTFFSLKQMDGLYNVTTNGFPWMFFFFPMDGCTIGHHGLLCYLFHENVRVYASNATPLP